MPCPSSRSIRMRERSRARRRRSSRTARPENAMPRSTRNRPRRAGGAPAHIATYKHLRPNLAAATPQAGRTPGPAVRTAYMPRSDGCDIGPLITGACWGAASGAGIRFSKVGICGAGFPKSIVGPRHAGAGMRKTVRSAKTRSAGKAVGRADHAGQRQHCCKERFHDRVPRAALFLPSPQDLIIRQEAA